MKKEEEIAELYLDSLYQNVIHEPDGNVTPDFSFEDVRYLRKTFEKISNSCPLFISNIIRLILGKLTIAVEVRRLNQQHRTFNDLGEVQNTLGTEQHRIPLVKTIENELSQYPHDINGNNYWLKLTHERIDGNLKDVKNNLKQAITDFQSQNENTPFNYQLGPGIDLQFSVKSPKLSRKYKIGIESDFDSGGMVVDIYVQDITHCIKDKEKKIKKNYNKYRKWQLLLVDYINCMDDFDEKDIVRQLQKPDCFEKIIIIKMDDTLQFEI